MLHVDTVDEHNASYDESAFDRIAASEDVEMLSRAMSRMPDIYRDVLLCTAYAALMSGRRRIFSAGKRLQVDKRLPGAQAAREVLRGRWGGV